MSPKTDEFRRRLTILFYKLREEPDIFGEWLPLSHKKNSLGYRDRGWFFQNQQEYSTFEAQASGDLYNTKAVLVSA